MKYLTLKQKVRHLPLFSTSLLSSLTKETDTLKVQLSNWKKKGVIIPLKKGLYVLNKEDRSIEPSSFYIANQIYIPSYVSLESALAFYGLIPEFVASTTSVTTRKTAKFKNELGNFTYQHINPENYIGFHAIADSNNLKVLIATPEKALIDFMYLNLSKFNIKNSSIFIESYRLQNFESLNIKELKQLAKAFNSKKLNYVIELFIKEVLQ